MKMYEPKGFQESNCKNYRSLDYQMAQLELGIDSDQWYTELTDIFDIPNKTLYVMPQEGWYNHEYLKFTVR